MPCSDPTMSDRDNRVYRAAELYKTFADRDDLPIPEWILNNRYIYPLGEKLDEVTAILCDYCKTKGENFIYNGRDRDCRHLADWWDEHKELDNHERTNHSNP